MSLKMYKNKSVKNIDNISFKLKKGETLGIIGATGSGKTTIINLLMRLYEKDAGSIRINGQEVSSIPPHELHTKFGVVFQNDVLFADTVRENIEKPAAAAHRAGSCFCTGDGVHRHPAGTV